MTSTVFTTLNAKDFRSLVAEAIKGAIRTEVEILSFNRSIEILKPFLTLMEADGISNVSLPTLNDWGKSGVVPSYNLDTWARSRYSDILDTIGKQNTKLCA